MVEGGAGNREGRDWQGPGSLKSQAENLSNTDRHLHVNLFAWPREEYARVRPRSQGCLPLAHDITHWVPECQLPFTHAAETSGEHLPISQKDGPHGPGPLVSLLSFLQDGQVVSTVQIKTLRLDIVIFALWGYLLPPGCPAWDR